MRTKTRLRWAGPARGGLISLGVLVTVLVAAPVHAAEGSIDYVEPGTDAIRVIYSLPGTSAAPELDTLEVSVNGEPVEAAAEIAADAETTVRRTTVLAMDVSNSMRRENRFEEAKNAAKAFLAAAPDDVYVGIVTFAGDVVVAQEPSLDRDASSAVIDALALSRQTALYDGVIRSVTASGTEGSRSVLVLSDGKDTTRTAVSEVTDAIEAAQIKLNVVALSQSASERSLLEPMAVAGEGSVISADDPQALTSVFAAEAQSLANQMLISAQLPDGLTGTEGDLAVSVEAAGEKFTDSAFVTLTPVGSQPSGPDPTKLVPVDPPGFQVSRDLMLAGLAGAALGALLLLLGVLGVFGGKRDTVEDRIAAYTRKGARTTTQPPPQGMAASAVGVANKALESNKSLEAALGQKLEAAGMSMKPAEWLLTHAGITVVAGLVALLLSSGSILYLLVGVAGGLLLPWVYLSFKRTRRVKAFKNQLADTLQLMAGSLSAGLSLAQSADTVVREGSEPISSEFRRALVEARLGVEIEDALSSIAERMESVDFEWVVMAIRIQREVGGNLSELLNNVAETIREREYLERQVSALSAEGRLSVWILGGLPPGFMGYLLLANPEYLQPLISTTIGYILLGVMAVLLTAGILWMKKLVKVEV